jgi:hypothetical protein
MQLPPFRISRIAATVCITLAITGAPTRTFGDNPNTYGLPLGTLSVTTPDPKLVTWAGETKPHHQMLATDLRGYTAASSEWYPAGVKFDPHGSVGIRKFFAKRDPGNVLEPAAEISVLTKDMPANSRFNQAQMGQTFGPYVPYQETYLGTTTAANDSYGVETVELVFVDGNNKQTVLDYQKIDIYPATTIQTHDSTTQAAVKTSYTGDAPRVQVQISSIYPGTETWVGIYPQNGNPQSATKFANSDSTSPPGDKSDRTLYVDPGNVVSSNSGTYELEVFQMTPTGAQAVGQPTQFTLNTTFKVNANVGLTH